MTGVTTPLTHGSLRGYAKIARDMTGDKQAEHEREMLQESEPGQRAAATIQRAVEGEAKIIDDLLDFSRVKTGKLKLQEQTIDLAAIVRTIAEAVSRDGEQNGVALTTTGLDAPVWIRGDSTRVEQIVWNLCSNAMKFTPRGGAVSIALEAEPAMARMTVTDSGIGIPPEALPHIFGLFSQNGLPRTTGRAGLGIGLALVRELTELHGGRVQAESDGPGKGTRFHVWLPLEVGSPAEKPGGQPRAMLNGKRVLLVDDDLDGLHAFAELLQLEGASVTAVASGAEALAAVRGNGSFDVILSDIDMPEMDGYALVEALRKAPGGAGMPVIALTGLGRQSDIQRATESGFAAHLTKPVALADLLVAMRNLGTPGGR